MSFTDNEPAVTAGTVTALVTAVLALLAAFGLPLTEQQRDAILGLVAVVAPIAVALLIRPHVTPTIKADHALMQVLAAPAIPPAAPPAA